VAPETITMPPEAQDEMALMISGHRASRMVSAARLDLAAFPTDGPRATGELDQATCP